MKIASADLTNHELLRDVASRGLPMLVSTGMSREEEIRESVALLRERWRILRSAAVPVRIPGTLQGRQPGVHGPPG